MPEHTIAENLTRLQNAKTAIGNAITVKGGTVSSGDGLEEFAADIASITNQYTSSDEGKVVSSGSLVAQTSITATANGTIDTTTNNEVVVNVPNSYTTGDEGKVVDNGQLVAQTAATYTANDTYDTTLINSVTVNVSSSSASGCAELYDSDTFATKVQLCLSITNGKAILSGISNVGSAEINYYIDPIDLKLSDFFSVNEKIITGRGLGAGGDGYYSMQCKLYIEQNYISIKTNTSLTPRLFYIYLDTQ